MVVRRTTAYGSPVSATSGFASPTSGATQPVASIQPVANPTTTPPRPSNVPYQSGRGTNMAEAPAGPLYNNTDSYYAEILKAYQDLLNQQKQAPLPADVSGYTGAASYGAAGAQSGMLYNQLGQQAGQMTQVLGGINEQMRALLDPNIGAAERAAILEMLRPEQRQSQAVYLYGY